MDFFDREIDRANNSFLLGIIVKQLNRNNLKTYLKVSFFGGIPSLLATALTDAPVFQIFFFCLCIFILYVSILALLSEKFRPSVLNDENCFENTKYILYFFIYTGLFGSIFTGWIVIGWLYSVL